MTGYLIIGTFLLGNLALGLWAGRGVKTMKDYVLANRSFNTAGAGYDLPGYLHRMRDDLRNAHPLRISHRCIIADMDSS